MEPSEPVFISEAERRASAHHLRSLFGDQALHERLLALLLDCRQAVPRR